MGTPRMNAADRNNLTQLVLMCLMYGAVIGMVVLAFVGCATWRPVPGYVAAETACKAEVGPYRPIGATVALAISPVLMPLGQAADAQEYQPRWEACMTKHGFPPGATIRERVSTK